MIRPQIHFTARKGWLNDPNGCLFYKGEWHLFYQHNPHGIEWGNMSWGHAVSRDLVHWDELPLALAPDNYGVIYSGSAVIDHHNSAGFQTGTEPVMVAAFTYAGEFGTPKGPYTQALAYSHDRGRTWTKYAGNPVVGNIGGGGDRDPKVFWYEPTRRWVMALYFEDEQGGKLFALFHSSDLKQWTMTQKLAGFYECPELFPLSVAEDKRVLWVLQAANSEYVVGEFDGASFTALQSKRKLDFGFNYYAAQNFNHAEDGKQIQIGWMRGGSFPNAEFNQQMSFPCELRLEKDADGYVLCRRFMLDFVQGEKSEYTGEEGLASSLASRGDGPAYLRMEGRFSGAIEISYRGKSFRLEDGVFTHGDRSATLDPRLDLTTIELLLDVTSLEILLNQGRAGGTFALPAVPTNAPLEIKAPGLERGCLVRLA